MRGTDRVSKQGLLRDPVRHNAVAVLLDSLLQLSRRFGGECRNAAQNLRNTVGDAPFGGRRMRRTKGMLRSMITSRTAHSFALSIGQKTDPNAIWHPR